MNRSAPLIAGLLFAGLAFAADTEALVQKLRSSNPDERREAARALSDLGADAKGATKAPVSYTHLTLPTICSV